MKHSYISLSCMAVFFLGTAVPAFSAEKAARKSGVLLENMDRSVKPCQDFYKFANGSWLQRTEIPADQTQWGVFGEISERNKKILHEILDDAAYGRKKDAKGSIGQLIGDYYYSAMDTVTIEAEGIKPLASEFKKIQDIRNASDLQKELSQLHSHFIFPGFAFVAGQDAKNSNMVIGQIFQGGLGLPDRDYYFKDDPSTTKIRSEYVAHVTKMFELLGESNASASQAAKTIMDLETRLAKASMTAVEQRDPNAVYHKMSMAELSKLAPEFAWKDYFRDIGLASPGDLNVAQPEFVKEFARMTATVPVQDWKTYLRWNLINRSSGLLNKAFADQDFHFYERVLRGAKEMSPRWKTSLEATDGSLGEALGQLYVARAFSPESKARVKKMVENLKSAMRDRLLAIDWIGEDTRRQALKKMDAFTVKIGYPDKWRDYSKLSIDRGPYVLNAMRTSRFGFDFMLSKIGKAPDRSEWVMTPPTVNAYYEPSMNEIVFPAGILQPPFFDPDADDAVNYGRIGAVIGHEITHGFDDQGSQYDAQGNLQDWWSKDDREKFDAQATVLEHQFNKYNPIDTLHINGKLTLGENIADLGGLKIAYSALKKTLGANGGEKIDGFTPEQRFFIGFAQAWCSKYRPERLRLQLATNPHSPPDYRVIGTLSNMPEFFEAFGCKVTDPVARPESDRAKIW